MNNELVAKIIKERCKKLGFSVKGMLEACNVSRNFMYDFVRLGTKPSIETLEAFADYLGCSVDYLLGRTDYPEINNGQFEYDGVKRKIAKELPDGYIVADEDAD